MLTGQLDCVCGCGVCDVWLAWRERIAGVQTMACTYGAGRATHAFIHVNARAWCIRYACPMRCKYVWTYTQIHMHVQTRTSHKWFEDGSKLFSHLCIGHLRIHMNTHDHGRTNPVFACKAVYTFIYKSQVQLQLQRLHLQYSCAYPSTCVPSLMCTSSYKLECINHSVGALRMARGFPYKSRREWKAAVYRIHGRRHTALHRHYRCMHICIHMVEGIQCAYTHTYIISCIHIDACFSKKLWGLLEYHKGLQEVNTACEPCSKCRSRVVVWFCDQGLML